MSGEDKRVARLVDALSSVACELEPETVLRRLVEAGCSLVDARYGALGVVGDDGRLEQFLHVGMPTETVETIGALPRGHGVLGLLIREPQPLRLVDIAEHPASTGFPDHHPQMRSFLGVPIRVRDRVFGNLYLTEKESAEAFTAEDEELAVALAALAGVAIFNARMHHETRQRQRWLDAVREINAALLEGSASAELMQTIAACARELVDADVASVAVPSEQGSLVLCAADGLHAEELRGTVYPRDGSVSGDVIGSGVPEFFDDMAADLRVAQPVVRLGTFGPAMCVPLIGAEGPFGSLMVANRAGGARFDAHRLAQVETLASQASVALAYRRAQEHLRRFSLLEERERIGRELHDSVLQRLFGLGLGLDQVAMRLAEADPPLARRVQDAVDDLDGTIRQLRMAVLALQPPPDVPDLRATVVRVCRQVARVLGFEPDVTFAGEHDDLVTADLVSADLVGHLDGVLREMLTNVAKHAQASHVDVTVTIGTTVSLRVADNGRGLPGTEEAGGHGLRNLRRRAETLGGLLRMSSAPERGTVMEWTVPLT